MILKYSKNDIYEIHAPNTCALLIDMIIAQRIHVTSTQRELDNVEDSSINSFVIFVMIYLSIKIVRKVGLEN